LNIYRIPRRGFRDRFQIMTTRTAGTAAAVTRPRFEIPMDRKSLGNAGSRRTARNTTVKACLT
jgi:hypothetical protein